MALAQPKVKKKSLLCRFRIQPLLPTGWSYLPGLLPAPLICQSHNHDHNQSYYRKREYHNKFTTYGGCRFSLSCSAIGSRGCQSRGHARKRFLIGHSGPMRLKEGVLKRAGGFLQQEMSLAAKFTSFIPIGPHRLSIR